MKYLWILLVAFLIACGGQESSEFALLENEVETNPSTKNISELLDEYYRWAAAHPEVNSKRKRILQNAYDISAEHNRYNSRDWALENLILDYGDDPETIARLIELSQLKEQLQKNMAAHVLNQGISEKYPDNAEVQEQIAPKLPAEREELDTIITNLGRAMFDDNTMRLNGRLARQYIDACEAYAVVYNGNQESAELLHKAAETSRSLNNINQALELYDWILKRYPDHPRTSQALFLKAFTYDSNLKDVENARIYYQEFLDKYPDDEFAQSAQFLKDNLGKDDEELLEILQDKQEQ